MPNDDDDLYSQRDMPPDKPSRSRDSDNDEEDEQKTALVPKSIFGGHKCKVGDVKKFRIVAAYDDEYEISYVRGEKDKDKRDSKDDDSNETRDESERELDSMATDY